MGLLLTERCLDHDRITGGVTAGSGSLLNRASQTEHDWKPNFKLFQCCNYNVTVETAVGVLGLVFTGGTE